MQEVWFSLDAIFGLIGLVLGFALHKWFSERKIGEAQTRAEAIVRDAFHNVSFFAGGITELPELLADEQR